MKLQLLNVISQTNMFCIQTVRSFVVKTKFLLSSCNSKAENKLLQNIRNMSSISAYQYDTLNVSSTQDLVLNVELNRPEVYNAMNKTFWREILDCFRKIKDDKNCRAVVVSGAGKMFSSGLDFTDMMDMASKIASKEDVARKARFFYSLIEQYQQSFSAIEECQKPVVAAIHGGCIGGGANLACACDIRYCSADAYFAIKEIDIGIAADVGILQRLPKSIGNDSLLREYIYTCERINAESAKEIGIVSRIYPSKVEMMEAANRVAGIIAAKSPVAVQGSKMALNYSRDHSVREGLEFMTYWNMTMLQSEDVLKAAEATISKSGPPVFSKL